MSRVPALRVRLIIKIERRTRGVRVDFYFRILFINSLTLLFCFLDTATYRHVVSLLKIWSTNVNKSFISFF